MMMSTRAAASATGGEGLLERETMPPVVLMGRIVSPSRTLLLSLAALLVSGGGGYGIGVSSSARDSPSGSGGGAASPVRPVTGGTYAARRARELTTELRGLLGGGSSELTQREQAADKILQAARAEDLKPSPPISSVHFFEAKSRIEAGRVYPIMRTLPKGGALHVHSDSMASVEWLVSNATYDTNLFVCGDVDDRARNFSLAFSQPPSPALRPISPMPCAHREGWRRIVDLRAAASGGAAAFDCSLVSALTLVPPNSTSSSASGSCLRPYATLDDVWSAFSGALVAADGLIYYEPVHTVSARPPPTPDTRPLPLYPRSHTGASQAYVRHAIQTFANDNVQILELRHLMQGSLGRTYTLDGTLLSSDHVMTKIERLSAEAVEAAAARPAGSPGSLFSGVRVILCALRFESNDVVAAALSEAQRLIADFPDVAVGFDLVGQEDKGRPLLEFLPQLSGSPAPLYFHAGETVVIGGAADLNLVDAHLLQSKRIGHGFALAHHPRLRRQIQTNDVALEVCPLSNQVLMLVDDLRNHPLQTFVSENLAVTLSPDDPALWKAEGASHDWAAAFLSMDNRTGLATLKQLAANSIKYSSIGSVAKESAHVAWLAEWDRAIERILLLPS
jgi:adenosine deaminase CECR1